MKCNDKNSFLKIWLVESSTKEISLLRNRDSGTSDAVTFLNSSFSFENLSNINMPVSLTLFYNLDNVKYLVSLSYLWYFHLGRVEGEWSSFYQL